MKFLSDIWCGFKWTPWIRLEKLSKVIPKSPGVYRVKPINKNMLIYVGQTGNVRTRTSTLRREINRDEMPFRDPHTGAPCLWAWKDAEGMEFECSAAPTDIPELERRALECYLLWRYRLEYGESPLCSFGRFHKNYSTSSMRKKQIHGRRLPEGEINPASGPSLPPLKLKGNFFDPDWMGLTWSDPKPLNSQEISMITEFPGVYKIFISDKLLYIGETHKLKSRLLTHAKKDWNHPNVKFSFSIQPETILPHQLKELENDLIAGCYEQMKVAPEFQFVNLQ